MKYYNQDIKEIYNNLKTSENGLTDEEVKIRLHKNGFNLLEEGKRRTKFSIFLKQFQNLMIILLLVVGVLSFLYALFGDGDYLDPIVILGCTFVNILMGYVQESKAEDAIEKCQRKNIRDWNTMKSKVRDSLGSYIYQTTKRDPIILPIFLEV